MCTIYWYFSLLLLSVFLKLASQDLHIVSAYYLSKLGIIRNNLKESIIAGNWIKHVVCVLKLEM